MWLYLVGCCATLEDSTRPRGEVAAKATLVGLVDPSLEKQPITGSLKDVRRFMLPRNN